MKTTSVPLLVLGLALSSVAAGQSIEPVDPHPADFNWQLPLTVSGDNGVVQFELPLEVYQRSLQADLTDLRVFTTDGKPAPFHLLRQSGSSQTQQRKRDTVQFPIWAEAAADPTDQISVRVLAGRDGAVEWKLPPPNKQPAEEELHAIIVDLGAAASDESLAAVILSQPQDLADYQASLAISRSSDLKLWDDVAQSQVGWFSSTDGQQQLRTDRISIGKGQGRYLKLRWRQGEPVQFPTISAIWRSRSVSEPTTHEWIIEAQPGRFDSDLVYQASPSVAATGVGLQLAEINSILSVRLGRYRLNNARPQQWRFRSAIDATYYRLLRDGSERQSSNVTIRALANDQWVLRTNSAVDVPPKLVLRWQPDTLIFLARGNSHILAVGAPSQALRAWRPGTAPLAQVAPGYSRADLRSLEHAVASATGAAPAVPTNRPPTPVEADLPQDQRYWLLWATLGLGVLFLAFMSWRLYQQMSNETDAS